MRKEERSATALLQISTCFAAHFAEVSPVAKIKLVNERAVCDLLAVSKMLIIYNYDFI